MTHLSIEPMLASPNDGTPIERLARTHVFDTKLDGVRMMMSWDGDTLRLITRSGRVANDSFPDLLHAPIKSGVPLVLDGEVIAGVGFQDAARREKVTRVRQAEALAASLPATFVAFDLLVDGAKDLRKVPYWTRRDRLDMLAQYWDGPFKPTFVSEFPSVLEDIRKAGGEGVIAKRKTSLYVPGRSKSWVKYKLTTSVTCIAVGYDKGHGHRADIGAVHLAMVGDKGPVQVGKVGTGFTARTITEMKALLDNARSGDDLPLVEVECLGLTRDGRLRMPSFKGVRSDLNLLDANITQLEGLTRS